MAGGYIALPSSLSAWPSVEWHSEQDCWKVCDPSWTDPGVEGTGFFRFSASIGITTSLAALAKACSTVEGFRCAEQAESKNAARTRTTLSSIARLQRNLITLTVLCQLQWVRCLHDWLV